MSDKLHERTNVDYSVNSSFALQMDESDSLSNYRNEFFIPQTDSKRPCIYLCGNSLGLQSKGVEEIIQQELSDWRDYGVEGHFHAAKPWMPYHEFFAPQLASVVGALEKEVVVMNTLTTNLHLLMVSFYRPKGKRCKIVIEKGAFPSDKYAMDSQLRFHGLDPESNLIQLTPRAGEETMRLEDIEKIIHDHKDEIALIMLGGVNYYTGQFFPLKRIAELGHQIGAMVGYDLAHAVGNVPLHLHDWNVDFAVWCHYKYMNGGPGCIAGAFVHQKHLNDATIPRFEGWWGHDKSSRFLMQDQFIPMKSAEAWQLSNAPVFSMAPLLASLKLFDEIGMDKLRQKSERLTGYMHFLFNELNNDRIRIITPNDPSQRGCQLSIQVKQGDKSLFDKITKRGVIADWREPDVIRVAPVPLYNSFQDVFDFVRILAEEINQ